MPLKVVDIGEQVRELRDCVDWLRSIGAVVDGTRFGAYLRVRSAISGTDALRYARCAEHRVRISGFCHLCFRAELGDHLARENPTTNRDEIGQLVDEWILAAENAEHRSVALLVRPDRAAPRGTMFTNAIRNQMYRHDGHGSGCRNCLSGRRARL